MARFSVVFFFLFVVEKAGRSYTSESLSFLARGVRLVLSGGIFLGTAWAEPPDGLETEDLGVLKLLLSRKDRRNTPYPPNVARPVCQGPRKVDTSVRTSIYWHSARARRNDSTGPRDRSARYTAAERDLARGSSDIGVGRGRSFFLRGMRKCIMHAGQPVLTGSVRLPPTKTSPPLPALTVTPGTQGPACA
ncbi:hypothetical protein RF55_8392 [Lasius niger]|uniref:Uncharacterized protein n=1 Tax=Lasius niger TaxID=67767 RepID=A0A0J7NGP9_LASNI|nr:hypothetical protein RF55_8392 [Lasius niger]